MKRTVSLVLAAILILGMAFAVTACSKKEQTPTPQQTDTTKKVLKVGSETTYPPFESSSANGQYDGFDMDLIRAIGAAEGYEVQIQSLGFDALIPAVNAGKIDCAISAMTINDERKQSVDFSDPYFNAGLIIAVAENDTTIKSLDDLKGKRLAAEVGTTGKAASDAVKAKDPKTTVKTFDSVGEAFMELEKGGVDAVINDRPVTDYYVKNAEKGKVKMVGEEFSIDAQYGIPVKKGNTAIIKVINDGLAKIKANGEYQKIYDKWFGAAK
ncbi:MAG TPA: basic amino acid ABC transporter substrate-binding protein [Syntrophomonadaceae bacterium]|nr:basic amino acid ABC transporter substrate-binding protein [Syntrophomonadaceae bacterium]